jgi:excisionase family DNA binding protein
VVRTPHNAAQPKRRLLNLRDVAAELDVSFDTVDRFLRAGRLPFVRLPSGRRRVDRSDLDAAIADWKAENR